MKFAAEDILRQATSHAMDVARPVQTPLHHKRDGVIVFSDMQDGGITYMMSQNYGEWSYFRRLQGAVGAIAPTELTKLTLISIIL